MTQQIEMTTALFLSLERVLDLANEAAAEEDDYLAIADWQKVADDHEAHMKAEEEEDNESWIDVATDGTATLRHADGNDSVDSRHVRLHPAKDRVSAKVVDAVIIAVKIINRQMFEKLTDAKAQKVVLVDFKANLRWDQERQDKGQFEFSTRRGTVGCEQISFADFPAISLTYQVLFRSGDELYSEARKTGYDGESEDRRLRYHSSPFRWADNKAGVRQNIENTIIPWTQEREDFLRDTVDRISKLGWLLKDFMGDFETNIAYALTQGGGALALPPPTENPGATDTEPKPIYFDRDGNIKDAPDNSQPALAGTEGQVIQGTSRPAAPAAPRVRNRERP